MTDSATAHRSPGSAVTSADRVPFAVDALAVLGFVLLGRASHEEGSAVVGTLSVAWPFWAGLAVGWAGIALVRRTGRSLPGRSALAGLVVTVGTMASGMLLRAATGAGTAPAFIAFASTFMLCVFVGWRLLATLTSRSRFARTPRAPRTPRA